MNTPHHHHHSERRGKNCVWRVDRRHMRNRSYSTETRHRRRWWWKLSFNAIFRYNYIHTHTAGGEGNLVCDFFSSFSTTHTEFNLHNNVDSRFGLSLSRAGLLPQPPPLLRLISTMLGGFWSLIHQCFLLTASCVWSLDVGWQVGWRVCMWVLQASSWLN